MKHCPRCGRENPQSASFCSTCGADLRKRVRPPAQAWTELLDRLRQPIDRKRAIELPKGLSTRRLVQFVLASLRLGEWRDFETEVRHIALHLERRHRIKAEDADLICQAVLNGLFYAKERDERAPDDDVFTLTSCQEAQADPRILAALFPRERERPRKRPAPIDLGLPLDRAQPTGPWICPRCGTRVEDWLCCWNCGQGYSPDFKSK